MRNLIIFLSLFVCSTRLLAFTNITTPTVSGVWTLTGSPYYIFNDIQVNATSSLVIMPGVDVVFKGRFSMNVYGILRALGTAAENINFHSSDTTGWSDTSTLAGGWKGLTMVAYGTGTDSSGLRYCNFFDMKKGAIQIANRTFPAEHCNFYHNMGKGVSCLQYTASNDTLQFGIVNCNFHDNVYYNNTTDGGRIINVKSGTVTITNCNVYDNAANCIIYGTGNFLLEKSNIYQNVQNDSFTESSTIYYKGGTGKIGLLNKNKIYMNTIYGDAVITSFDATAYINSNLVCNNRVQIGLTSLAACGQVEGGAGIRVNSMTANPNSTHTIIRNNIIANNYTPFYGAGIYVFWAKATIVNNDIVNNVSDIEGSAIYILNGASYGNDETVVIKNNILWNNQLPTWGIPHTPQVTIDLGQYVKYNYNWSQQSYSFDVNSYGSFVLSGDTSKNVVGTDPGFVAPDTVASVTVSALTADFRLKPTSACINKGDTTGVFMDSLGVFMDSVDYAGTPRIIDTLIDIGAYEYPTIVIPDTTTGGTIIDSTILNTITLTQAKGKIDIYPNPASSVVFVSLPEATGSLKLIDVSGKVIFEKAVVASTFALDVHNLVRGIYMLVWNDGSTYNKVQRFVVQ